MIQGQISRVTPCFVAFTAEASGLHDAPTADALQRPFHRAVLVVAR